MNYHDKFRSLGMCCVQQVSLLRLWEQLRSNQALPKFSSLSADDVSRSIDKLSFCEVVRTDTGPRFRVIQNGAQFERMYSQTRVGKFLDESLSPPIRDQAIEYRKRVVETREPSFSLSAVRKNNGPVIRYERLLLPFAGDGPHIERKVEQIVGVITLFSEENGFNIRDVTSGQIVEHGNTADG